MKIINFYLYLFTLCSLPFYMILRFSIFYGSGLWMYPGLIIIYLFFITVIKYSTSKFSYPNSSLILLMKIIFCYYLFLCFQAALLGSDSLGIIRRFWQHIIPLMFFFVSVDQLKNRKNINIALRIVGTLSVIISIIFIAEWFITNILQQGSFPWSLRMHSEGLIGDLYVSKSGETSLELSRIRGFRLGGPLLTNQNTSLFIIFGLIYFSSNFIYKMEKSKVIYLITILISLILLFARTPMVSLLIISFIVLKLLFNYKIKFKLILQSLSVFLIIIFLTFSFQPDLFGNLLFYYNIYSMLTNPEGIIYSISSQFAEYLQFLIKNPLYIFNGVGFGYWSGSGLFFESSDFGILFFHNMIGTLGFILIGIFLFKLFIKIKFLLNNYFISTEYSRYILISTIYIGTCILSTIHYTPMFHLANYCVFYMLLAIITNIFSNHGLQVINEKK